MQINVSPQNTVPRFRRLISTLSPGRPALGCGPARVRFVVDKVTLTGFPPCTSVSPFSIIPPVLHNNLHLNTALTRRSGRSLGTFKQSNALSYFERAWDRSIF